MKNKKFLIPYILAVVIFFNLMPANAQKQKLSLQEAVSIAIKNNPEIMESSLEVDKSHQQKVIAKSMYMPTVSASIQALHYFELPAFFGFGTYSSGDKIPYARFGGKDQAGALIYASQPIYNAYRSPTLKRSELLEEQSKISLTEKQIDISALVKQTYLQILVLNERIKLQEESINRNQRVLKDAKSLLLQGKALRVDTLRAYTSVKNLEPESLKLSYSVETSVLQLKTLLGIESSQELALTDSLIHPVVEEIPQESQVYETAKTNRPDLQIQALQEKFFTQQAKLSSAAKKPTVSAIGQYQVQTQTNQFDYSKANYPSNSYVGLQVSVPIFNGFSNTAAVKQAELSKRQAALKLNNEYEQLRALVHQTLADWSESVVRIRTTETVKSTARLSYDIIQYRYSKGVASRLELTDAELALTQAQSNYLEAVYDYLSARIALFRVMGKVE